MYQSHFGLPRQAHDHVRMQNESCLFRGPPGAPSGSSHRVLVQFHFLGFFCDLVRVAGVAAIAISSPVPFAARRSTPLPRDHPGKDRIRIVSVRGIQVVVIPEALLFSCWLSRAKTHLGLDGPKYSPTNHHYSPTMFSRSYMVQLVPPGPHQTLEAHPHLPPKNWEDPPFTKGLRLHVPLTRLVLLPLPAPICAYPSAVIVSHINIRGLLEETNLCRDLRETRRGPLKVVGKFRKLCEGADELEESGRNASGVVALHDGGHLGKIRSGSIALLPRDSKTHLNSPSFSLEPVRSP